MNEHFSKARSLSESAFRELSSLADALEDAIDENSSKIRELNEQLMRDREQLEALRSILGLANAPSETRPVEPDSVSSSEGAINLEHFGLRDAIIIALEQFRNRPLTSADVAKFLEEHGYVDDSAASSELATRVGSELYKLSIQNRAQRIGRGKYTAPDEPDMQGGIFR